MLSLKMSKDQEFVETQDIMEEDPFTQQPIEDEGKEIEIDAKDSSFSEPGEGKDEQVEKTVAPPPGEDRAKQKRPPSAALTAFMSAFDQSQLPEEKIRISLDFMRASIMQPGNPRFEDFWTGRRYCLPLFKETLSPKGRALLWAEYIELSSEARRLKEILDEQSAFAAEQIELAIKALESDLEHYDHLLQQVPEMLFPEICETIASKQDVYNGLQRELHLLNTFASRINALRKEVIKTGMRVRYKNQFFERLSSCGDRVFPRRKELIKSISDEFIVDVENFISAYFGDNQQHSAPLFVLREEIKALQSIAKQLTLNTHSFTETRLRLSECWDMVKHLEKDRKKEFAQKKQAYKQNADLVMEKIKVFGEECSTGNVSQEEAHKRADEIIAYMKTIELGRDEVRGLRDELQRAKKPIYDKLREAEQHREREEKDREKVKREKINEMKQRIANLTQESEQLDIENLISSRDALFAESELLSMTKIERQMLDKGFKQLKDAITEKKEKAWMTLSPEDLQSLERLRDLLNQRKEHRQEIKNQLESYRKALGGSGFDFEKAMMYREMIEVEKERLEKANASIQEIEEKIDELES